MLFILDGTSDCHFACVWGRGGAAGPAAPAECGPLLRVCKSRGATRPCNTRWPRYRERCVAAPLEGGFLPPAEPHVSLGLHSNVDGGLFFPFFLSLLLWQKWPEVNLPWPPWPPWPQRAGGGRGLFLHARSRPRQAADGRA